MEEATPQLRARSRFWRSPVPHFIREAADSSSAVKHPCRPQCLYQSTSTNKDRLLLRSAYPTRCYCSILKVFWLPVSLVEVLGFRACGLSRKDSPGDLTGTKGPKEPIIRYLGLEW